MTLAALVFDKDGTLFNFGSTWEVWARSFLLRMTNNNPDRAAFVGDQIGFDMANSTFRPDSIVIAGTAGQVATALAPHFPDIPVQTLFDQLNQDAADTPQSPAVPLIPFLDQLRAGGYKLGVATNDAEAPALAHLTAAGILDHFDFVAGFDSGHGAKPNPGQLTAFARAVNHAPDRIAMIGDSTHDLIAGRAAGMTTVGVLTGIALADDLAPHADVVLPDIGHLIGWLADGAD